MKIPMLTLMLLTAPTLAFAQSAPQPAPQAAQATQAEGDREGATGEDLAERDARVDCIRYTGTRIAQEAPPANAADDVDKVDELDRDGCVAAGGSVYTREDLRRTGRNNIGEALRALDPAIH